MPGGGDEQKGRPRMVGLGWTVFLLSIVLSADFGWSCYRDWRSRRLAYKRGRTLTQKFTLLE